MNQKGKALGWSGLVLLMACAGDGNGTGPGTEITVAGVVLDRSGEPVRGATLVVPGHGPAVSGSDGRFSISGIHVPYDVALLVGGANRAVVYQGLTRSDPTLLCFCNVGVKAATITGRAPLALNHTTVVFFLGGSSVGVGWSIADPATGEYELVVRWSGAAPTLAGRLQILRWPNTTGMPTSYNGYATKPLTITAGAASPGNNFIESELIDPPEQTIAGGVQVPPGYTLIRRAFYFNFGEQSWFGLYEDGTLSSTFSYVVPAMEGAVYSVQAAARDPSSRESDFLRRRVRGNSTNVNMTLEVGPHLTLPPNQATALDVNTSFEWSNGGGNGVNLFQVFPPDGSTNPTFFVLTTRTDAKIPELAAAGPGLPPGASYGWGVDRIFPVPSVDDAASETFGLLPGAVTDLGQTTSEMFTFITRQTEAVRLPVPPVTRTSGPTARAASKERWPLSSPGRADASHVAKRVGPPG